MPEYRIAEILAYAVMKSEGNGAPDVEVERYASVHDARAHVSRLWEEEAAKPPKAEAAARDAPGPAGA